MRGSRKFCERGSNFDSDFLVDEGREDPNTAISWSTWARQRNVMTFRWRADDSPTMNADLVAL